MIPDRDPPIRKPWQFVPGGWSILCVLGAWWSTAGTLAAQERSAKPLNVILILVDDLGWTDLGCYGSDLYETPQIDQLARDGMRFTQAYSACTVCSPTRASILTGKYPARLHITDWIPGLVPANPKLTVPSWTKYLPLEEATLAELFQAAGYATASIGKWHLGEVEYYPEKHGFGVNLAGTIQPSPASYFAPYKMATLQDGPAGEYLTDRLATEAVSFIERNRDQPFFLYWPHFAVHLPIQAKRELIDKYQSRLRPGLAHTNPTYAAMLDSLDQAVGRVRQQVRKLGISERTAIIFTSDNGGHIPTTSNRPLRFGKASCYEGGVRVPLIVYWPGVTVAGGVSDVPVISPDLYPTLREMAALEHGSPVPERVQPERSTQAPPKQGSPHRVDGVSLVPVLRRTSGLDRDAVYWHYPHYQLYQQGGTTPYGAIRAGHWKLIEIYDRMGVELYNLAEDLGEQHDLAERLPEKVAELRARLRAWRIEVGAQMPVPNPAYDPNRPEHIPRTKKKAQPAQ